MCAIAGYVGLPIEDGVPEKLLKTMKRRGPDGSGCWTGPMAVLLHTRLAIIDPAGGAQPMTLTAPQETYRLVYNGELYNAQELRNDLETLGHSFLGHSDTEVLLHGYAQWGEGVLQRLNGIFAFGVWEERSQRLFLARDRMGVKPLFYTIVQNSILFASEIKTILAHPEIKPRLDEQGAAQVLLLGPGRIPGSGVFYGIQELEPGCCGYFQQGHFAAKRYWQLTDREHTDDFDTTLQKVRYLVEDAICRQMVSDVPIGCFLSGGLDSSIISAVCANAMGENGQQLMTFSVDYRDNDRYFQSGKFQPQADGDFIRIMCDTLHCNHHWTILEQTQLLETLEDATCARDLPGMADVDFSLLAFCTAIRKEVKVALSGECADEIFGGYPWYRDPQIRDADGFPWAQNTVQRSKLMHPDLLRKLSPVEFVQEQYRDTIARSDILPGTDPLEKRMKQMMNLNLRWFMQTLLDRKDRMSMFNGLEVRVPFCDHRIAEYLYGVPWSFKDYQGREKGLLRKAMEGLLPEQVLYRKKSPYPKTHHPEYLTLVRSRLYRLLEQKDVPLFMLIPKHALTEFLAQSTRWPWYGQLMTEAQTMAYFLQLNFWLEHYEIDMLY